MSLFDKVAAGAKAVQNWWQDDTVLLPTKALTSKSTVKNVEYEAQKEQIVDETMAQEYEDAKKVEEQREIEHGQQINEIREAAKQIATRQVQANAEKEIQQKRQSLFKTMQNNEKMRQEELNKAVIEESFNFYKVGDLLKSGLTLKGALTGAGCREDFPYKLDYQGRIFIRLQDDSCDNVCSNVAQNITLKEYLAKNNGVVVAVGFPGETTLSIGALIYDKEFGFMLIKTDRYIQTYVDNTIEQLYHTGWMNDKLGFDRIALGSTFMKVAVPCAICINSEYGMETEDDMEQYKQMLQYDKVAAQRFNNALKYFDLKLGG